MAHIILLLEKNEPLHCNLFTSVVVEMYLISCN